MYIDDSWLIYDGVDYSSVIRVGEMVNGTVQKFPGGTIAIGNISWQVS